MEDERSSSIGGGSARGGSGPASPPGRGESPLLSERALSFSLETFNAFAALIPGRSSAAQITAADLVRPAFLRDFVSSVWPDVAADLSPAGAPASPGAQRAAVFRLIRALDDATEGKYAASVGEIERAFSGPSNPLLPGAGSTAAQPLIAAFLLAVAVESPVAPDLVQGIMDLPETAQLEIQNVLRHLKVVEEGEGDFTESSAESEFEEDSELGEPGESVAGSPGAAAAAAAAIHSASLDSAAGLRRAPTRSSRREQRPPTSPVPPLSLRALHRQKSRPAGGGPQKGLAGDRRTSNVLTAAGTGAGGHGAAGLGGGPSLGGGLPAAGSAGGWKTKYEELRDKYREALAAREEATAAFEALRKEAEATAQAYQVQLAELRARTDAKKDSVAETVEALERDLFAARRALDEQRKEAAEQARTQQALVERLRDENQLLQVDASRAAALEAQVERAKNSAAELARAKEDRAQLEAQLQDYVKRAVAAEAAGADAGGGDLRRSLESARERAGELEKANAALKAEKAALATALDGQTQQLAAANRSAKALEQSLEQARAEFDEKLLLMGGEEGVREVDLRRKIAQLEAQLENGTAEPVRELEEQLAAARGAESARISGGAAGVGAAAAGEGGGAALTARAEIAEARATSLEAQLEAFKLRQEKELDDLRRQLAAERDLQTAEALRDSEFYQRTLAEERAVNRRQQATMAAAFHALGLRLFQLKALQAQKDAEHEATLVKMAEGQPS